MSTSPSENPVFTFARVDPDTLAVTLKYNANGGDRWSPDDLECLVPFDVLSDQAVRDETTGLVSLVEDPLKVQAKTAQAWKDLRTERNARLAACDWVGLADAHVSQERKDAWFTYRQALRDLPDEVSITGPQDLVSIPWPQDPTVSVAVAPSSGSRLSNILSQFQEPEVVPEEPVQEPVASEPVAEVTEPVASEPVAEVVEPVAEVVEPVASEVPEAAPETQ